MYSTLALFIYIFMFNNLMWSLVTILQILKSDCCLLLRKLREFKGICSIHYRRHFTLLIVLKIHHIDIMWYILETAISMLPIYLENQK